MVELEDIGRKEIDKTAAVNMDAILQSWKLCTCHSDLSGYVDEMEKKLENMKVGRGMLHCAIKRGSGHNIVGGFL